MSKEGKQTKQVIVIRKDLHMRRGKECAQASHASAAFLTRGMEIEQDGDIRQGKLTLSKAEIQWMSKSFTKVCLAVNSETELLEIQKIAEEADVACHLITDSGKTEFNGKPTNTCLALGPDYSERIDPITQNLKLY